MSPLLLLSLLSGVMWGAAGVFVRVLSAEGLDGLTIVFARVSLSAVMMLALILVTDRSLLRLRARDAWMFLGCALSMLGLNAFYTVSVDMLSLSLAAVLLSLSPVFMLIMARVLFGEAVTSRKVLCMAASVVGCAMVSGLFDGVGGLSAPGIAAGLSAAFFYAAYGILSKRASSGGYGIYTILFYSMLVSAAVLVPFADYGALAGYAAGPAQLGFLALHSAVASFLPYILYTTAVTRGDAGTSSLLAACGEPIAAALFGVLLFSEAMTPVMAVGMAVAVGSMAVICMPPGAVGRRA